MIPTFIGVYIMSTVNAQDVIDAFDYVAKEKYGSTDFAHGYFMSFLASMINDLPEYQRINTLSTMTSTMEKLKKGEL